jgi:hypothetical protein
LKGIEEFPTKGTAVGMKSYLIILTIAQYKGEWAAPPLLHTTSWLA